MSLHWQDQKYLQKYDFKACREETIQNTWVYSEQYQNGHQENMAGQ
jgi:hypothetical protein